MLRLRLSAAFLVCFALVQVGTAQQSSAPAQGQSGQGQGQSGQQGSQNGQQNDGQQQPPAFRGGVDFVRVDVIVSDRKAQPVTNLTEADFEVLEDGKPQAIEQFRFVKIDGTTPVETRGPIRTRQDEERAAANEDARIFVFFLDDYHVRLGNSMAVRKPLMEF